MNVKIDTREKFHVITLNERFLSANMTDDFERMLLKEYDSDSSNLVLSLQHVESIDLPIASKLLSIQQKFYDRNASFVVCCMDSKIEEMLDQEGILEQLNTTPTESEAGDIVQLEEIERELLG